MMEEKVTLSLDKDSKNKFICIAEKEFSDMSKLLRKWISENWKEEYSED